MGYLCVRTHLDDGKAQEKDGGAGRTPAHKNTRLTRCAREVREQLSPLVPVQPGKLVLVPRLHRSGRVLAVKVGERVGERVRAQLRGEEVRLVEEDEHARVREPAAVDDRVEQGRGFDDAVRRAVFDEQLVVL